MEFVFTLFIDSCLSIVPNCFSANWHLVSDFCRNSVWTSECLLRYRLTFPVWVKTGEWRNATFPRRRHLRLWRWSCFHFIRPFLNIQTAVGRSRGVGFHPRCHPLSRGQNAAVVGRQCLHHVGHLGANRPLVGLQVSSGRFCTTSWGSQSFTTSLRVGELYRSPVVVGFSLTRLSLNMSHLTAYWFFSLANDTPALHL